MLHSRVSSYFYDGLLIYSTTELWHPRAMEGSEAHGRSHLKYQGTSSSTPTAVLTHEERIKFHCVLGSRDFSKKNPLKEL